VAVYGDAATPTCDDTEPHPSNDYGLSKLRAEEVLKVWREGDAANRKLLIIRPALVYGEGNLANMYRLIDAIATGRYFNVGAGENIKSIAYVKNLVEATWYLFNRLPNGLFVGNYSDQPHLKTAEIVSVIASQLGKPIPKSIPKNLLMLMAKPFDLVISLTGKDLPISSMRVKKMGTQTFHQAELVFKQGFRPQFNTIEGLQRMVEWYKLHQLQKRKYKSPA
jgi:nucleoside-diphosphate-sugar epimerase